MNNVTVVNNLTVSGTTTLDDLTVNGNATIGNISFNDLTVAGTSTFDDNVVFSGDLATVNLTNGLTIYTPAGSAGDTLSIRNFITRCVFNNSEFKCVSHANGAGTRLRLQGTTTGEVMIGRSGVARVGSGTTPNASFFLTVGGTIQAPIFNAGTYFWTPTGSYYLNTDMKMYQIADAFNSLNIITSQKINFSLQSNKEADPTTGTIALQINDATNIVMNRPVMNNQTIYSLGDITTEGKLLAQGT